MSERRSPRACGAGLPRPRPARSHQGATGHVSARIPGTDRVLIRARGPGELGVRYTTAKQIIEVDFDGKADRQPSEAGLESPIEVFIHTAIYRARPEVNAVVHVHPPTVVLFTICNKPLLPLYGAYDPSGAATGARRHPDLRAQHPHQHAGTRRRLGARDRPSPARA